MKHLSYSWALRIVLLPCAFLCGCEDQPESPVEASPAVSVQAVPALKPEEVAPPPPPGTPGQQPPPTAQAVGSEEVDEDGNNVVVEGLNAAMRSYVKDNETVPVSLSALVEAGYLSRVPTPPAGKRYEIDRQSGRVTLMNN